jgi:hypothetical protein
MVTAITSFTSDTKYDLTINEQTGEATNCKCGDCQYRHHACKHIRAFNAAIDRAARFLLAVREVREMEYSWKANREMAFSPNGY